jgi:hypothetical protein
MPTALAMDGLSRIVNYLLDNRSAFMLSEMKAGGQEKSVGLSIRFQIQIVGLSPVSSPANYPTQAKVRLEWPPARPFPPFCT